MAAILARLACLVGRHDKRTQYLTSDGRPRYGAYYVYVCTRCKWCEYGGTS